MTQSLGGCCCVCGASDARTLVQINLAGGGQATLCGSHAIMHGRAQTQVRSEPELRELLRDRRGRRERRELGDELGVALTEAFHDERRARDRRQA
jgi:hypothetical protein